MKKTIMATAIVAALTACSASKETGKTGSIVGEWNVVELAGSHIDDATVDSKPFLGFSGSDNSVYGNLSCNTLTGNYKAYSATGKIHFGALGSTMMMCADMTVEQKMLNALGKVAHYEVADSTLLLKSSSGKALIKLTRK